MKKLVTAALILSMLLGISACGSQGGSDTTVTTDQSGETTTAAEETTVDLMADVPTGDYGGYTFHILGPETANGYLYTSIVVDELNGEVVNDAIFNRNRKIEDKLNIAIEYEEASVYSTLVNQLKSSVLAGDNAYDAAFNCSMYIGPTVTDGYLLDIYEVDKINLDKPWWDINTAEQYEIDGKLYMLQGDLNYQYLYNMWSVFFNQKLIGDFKLEDPYQLVLDGKWTIDKLIEYSRAVMQDLNNDGVYSLTDGDICGIVSNSSSYLALLHGTGEALITKDADNNPQFIGLTDRFSEVYDKILAVCGTSGVFTSYGSMTNSERFAMFAADKFLFSLMMMGSSEHLRDMTADFGILPLPKYDETQESYCSYVGPSVINLCIPASTEDLDRTGTILENLCAASYGTLRTAYFETTLQQKLLRDENSVKVLDIIYDNITAELGYVYGFGGIHTTYMDAVKNSEGIASAFAATESSVNTAIGDYLGKLDDNTK